MIATPAREGGYVPMMGNYESEVYYTRKEFMDELAKQVGQAYGLNDIRGAKECATPFVSNQKLILI